MKRPSMKYWIMERTPPEIAARIRTVYLPRNNPETDDDWTKGYRAAVISIANFIESNGNQP